MIGFLAFSPAAKFLGRSPRWLREIYHEIPHYKINGQILFDEVDLRKWMLRFRVEPAQIDIRSLVDRVVPRRQRGGRGRFKSEGAT